MEGSRLLLGASALLVSAFASAGQDSDDRARDVLAKSMERTKQVPCVAILYQRASGTPGPVMQVKVEQDGTGRTRLTVLQPSWMEGVTYVDDGKSWKTYLPDKNRLIVQASMRPQLAELQARLDLAAQNYRMQIEKPVNVAGRLATVITADPRSTAMLTRRYYVDRETGFLLRVETEGKEGLETRLDTKHIKFSKELTERSFDFNFTGEKPRRLDIPAPARIVSGVAVRPNLGFAPVIPKRIALGFVVQEPQLAGDNDFRFAAVRVTDGLVNGTVYQWKSAGDETPRAFQPQQGDKIARGVWFRFVGEVPSEARSQILESFIREAMRAMRLLLEPDPPPPALNDNGGSSPGIGTEEPTPKEPGPNCPERHGSCS